MLPEFLKTKEKLQKKLNYILKQAILSHLAPIDDIPESISFEGSKTVTIYEDGSVSETDPKDIGVNLEVKLEDVETMTHEMVLEIINRFAKKIAEEQKILFYEEIGRLSDEVGNVISGDGNSFSIDMLYQMLERIPRDFDEEGNLDELRCAVSPNLFPSIANLISQAEADPRFHALIERKKEEWRARESNRKLVG